MRAVLLLMSACIPTVGLDLPMDDDIQGWILIEDLDAGRARVIARSNPSSFEIEPKEPMYLITYRTPLEDLGLIEGELEVVGDDGRPLPLSDAGRTIQQSDGYVDGQVRWVDTSSSALAGVRIAKADPELCFGSGGCFDDYEQSICRHQCEVMVERPERALTPVGAPPSPGFPTCEGSWFYDGCRPLECDDTVPVDAVVVGPLDDLTAALSGTATVIVVEGVHPEATIERTIDLRGRCDGTSRIDSIVVHSNARLAHLGIGRLMVEPESDTELEDVALTNLSCTLATLRISRSAASGGQLASNLCELELSDLKLFETTISSDRDRALMSEVTQLVSDRVGLRTVSSMIEISQSRFSLADIAGDGSLSITDTEFDCQPIGLNSCLVLSTAPTPLLQRIRVRSTAAGLRVVRSAYLEDVVIEAPVATLEVNHGGTVDAKRFETLAGPTHIRGSAAISDWSSTGIIVIADLPFLTSVPGVLEAERVLVEGAAAGLTVGLGGGHVVDLTVEGAVAGVVLAAVDEFRLERFEIDAVTGVDFGDTVGTPPVLTFDRGSISAQIGISHPFGIDPDVHFRRTRFETSRRLSAR